MSTQKPYHRIWRPTKGYSWGNDIFVDDEKATYPSLNYLYDDLFANQLEKKSLITATRLILRDLNELFDYIEPCDDNLQTYSHRIYELFLRAATEFETNCKGVLKANDYSGPREEKDWSIKDYFKVARPTRLNEYKICFLRWATNHEFEPFVEWNPSRRETLSWYDSYNKVKHDRFTNFHKASLENLMNAIAGLLCILHSQFGDGMAEVGFNGIETSSIDESVVETELFTIHAPHFPEAEQYEFIWDTLKKTHNPVNSYTF